jgi:hypothetical protein
MGSRSVEMRNVMQAAEPRFSPDHEHARDRRKGRRVKERMTADAHQMRQNHADRPPMTSDDDPFASWIFN